MMDDVSREGPSDTEYLYSRCSGDVVKRGKAQALPCIVLRYTPYDFRYLCVGISYYVSRTFQPYRI
jgi:hypothetical protein